MHVSVPVLSLSLSLGDNVHVFVFVLRFPFIAKSFHLFDKESQHSDIRSHFGSNLAVGFECFIKLVSVVVITNVIVNIVTNVCVVVVVNVVVNVSVSVVSVHFGIKS